METTNHTAQILGKTRFMAIAGSDRSKIRAGPEWNRP
jgi:hypothetical protein